MLISRSFFKLKKERKFDLSAFSTASFEHLNKVIIHVHTGRFLIILGLCVPK